MKREIGGQENDGERQEVGMGPACETEADIIKRLMLQI